MKGCSFEMCKFLYDNGANRNINKVATFLALSNGHLELGKQLKELFEMEDYEIINDRDTLRCARHNKYHNVLDYINKLEYLQGQRYRNCE